MALTDHDTIDGVAAALAAARAFPELMVIPGVEINTDVPTGEAHILGYFIDYNNHKLQTTLARLRNSRVERAQKMIIKLASAGVHIDWQRVQEIAGSGSIARPHLALAMLEKGYISSVKEAFTRYIGQDGPAYVPREKITPTEAVKVVLQADGLPVLAHPFTVENPEALIITLKAEGLAGIEAYYNSYTAKQGDVLASLADRYGLITTAGSDYHGLDETSETMIGSTEVPTEVVERLTALTKQRLSGQVR